jgi:hypothetical protein
LTPGIDTRDRYPGSIPGIDTRDRRARPESGVLGVALPNSGKPATGVSRSPISALLR